MRISHAAAAFIVVIFFGAVIYLQIDLWRECRADHSWLYCMRVLEK